MLVYIDLTRKLYAYNSYISKEQSQKYLNGECVWVEEEIPVCGENEEIYLTNENTFEIRTVEIVTPQSTQLDRIEEMVSKLNEEIAQAAIDAYTLELIEGGVI